MNTKNEIIFKYLSQVVSFYINRDNTDVYVAGWLEQIDQEETILLRSITRLGEYDGFLFIRLQDVYRMEFQTLYLKKLTFLSNQIKFDNIPKMENCLSSILTYAQKQKKAIRIVQTAQSTSSIGTVEAYDGENLKLRQLNKLGDKNKSILISRYNIKFLSCDSDTERNIITENA